MKKNDINPTLAGCLNKKCKIVYSEYKLYNVK